MSQRLVITEVDGYGFTTDISLSAFDDEDMEALVDFCKDQRIFGQVGYSYLWVEFGIPDETGSTGECNSDTYIYDHEMMDILTEAENIAEIVKWLEEKGYQVHAIQSGSGVVSVNRDPDDFRFEVKVLKGGKR